MNRTRNNPIAAARRKPKAFTLLELMTVVLIIGLVLTILMPTLAQVRTMFLSRKTQHIINLISHACAAHRLDMEDYPADASELVQALTGRDEADGKAGYGFRLVERGKVYGPYGGTEKLRIATQSGGLQTFMDAFDRPILYYRCKVTEDEHGVKTYSYEEGLPGEPPEDQDDPELLEYLTGPGERFHRTDFVLISKGPNGQWDALYDQTESAWTDSDDIANFQR